MSLDCKRETADCARLNPCIQGLRTLQLTIQVWVWPGERIGPGPRSGRSLASELVMPKYEWREVGSREILASGGKLSKGDLVVKDITPAYQKADGSGQGGFSREQLDPQSTWNADDYESPIRNREVEYVVSGDISGIFRFHDLDCSDPVAWKLTLTNTRKSQ